MKTKKQFFEEIQEIYEGDFWKTVGFMIDEENWESEDFLEAGIVGYVLKEGA